MSETPDERKDRINAARRESADISQQVGIDVTSLLVRPVARQAYHEFQQSMKSGREAFPQVLPQCNGKEEKYALYPDDEIPSDGKAKMMCGACEFFEKCDRYADLEKPKWGVYGGRVYGREFADLEETLDTEAGAR